MIVLGILGSNIKKLANSSESNLVQVLAGKYEWTNKRQEIVMVAEFFKRIQEPLNKSVETNSSLKAEFRGVEGELTVTEAEERYEKALARLADANNLLTNLQGLQEEWERHEGGGALAIEPMQPLPSYETMEEARGAVRLASEEVKTEHWNLRVAVCNSFASEQNGERERKAGDEVKQRSLRIEGEVAAQYGHGAFRKIRH